MLLAFTALKEHEEHLDFEVRIPESWYIGSQVFTDFLADNGLERFEYVKWQEAIHIERQIRAFSPWPSTFTFIGEKRIKIHKGQRMENQAPSSSSPGEILEIRKEGIAVCCGEHSILLIERLQPENKNNMDAYAFSLGGRIKIGEKFS